MNTQKRMTESFQMTHRGFVKNLIEGLSRLEQDIEASREIDTVCTGEWCRAIEFSLDELAKDLYSISEPRWMADDFSRTLRNSRRRLHDLYAKYRGSQANLTH
jgi:predicted lipase